MLCEKVGHSFLGRGLPARPSGCTHMHKGAVPNLREETELTTHWTPNRYLWSSSLKSQAQPDSSVLVFTQLTVTVPPIQKLKGEKNLAFTGILGRAIYFFIKVRSKIYATAPKGLHFHNLVGKATWNLEILFHPQVPEQWSLNSVTPVSNSSLNITRTRSQLKK